MALKLGSRAHFYATLADVTGETPRGCSIIAVHPGGYSIAVDGDPSLPYGPAVAPFGYTVDATPVPFGKTPSAYALTEIGARYPLPIVSGELLPPTPLKAAAPIGTAVLSVSSTAGMPSTGTIRIGDPDGANEVISYSAIGPDTITLVGTTASAHANGDPVKMANEIVVGGGLTTYGGTISIKVNDDGYGGPIAAVVGSQFSFLELDTVDILGESGDEVILNAWLDVRFQRVSGSGTSQLRLYANSGRNLGTGGEIIFETTITTGTVVTNLGYFQAGSFESFRLAGGLTTVELGVALYSSSGGAETYHMRTQELGVWQHWDGAS